MVSRFNNKYEVREFLEEQTEGKARRIASSQRMERPLGYPVYVLALYQDYRGAIEGLPVGIEGAAVIKFIFTKFILGSV